MLSAELEKEAEAVEEVSVSVVEVPADDVSRAREWPMVVTSLLSGWGWGMVTPLRLYFLVVLLQVPLPAAGLIEGIALGGPRIVRALLDGEFAWRHSRWLGVLGHLLEGAARPLLAVAGSSLGALGAVTLEAVGRGAAESPRVALSGSAVQNGAVPVTARVGGVLGAVSAELLLLFVVGRPVDLFFWAAAPAVAAAFFALFLRPPLHVSGGAAPERAGLRLQFTSRFWLFTVASAALATGSISVSFFLLRLASFEQSPAMLAVAVALWASMAALTSLAARLLRVRWGLLPLMITGYSILLVATLLWAPIGEAWQGWALLALSGAAAALVSGTGEALALSLVVPRHTAAASRTYSVAVGLAFLPGNALVGLFWVLGGPATAFAYAAWSLAVGLALLLAWLPWLRRGYLE